MKRFSRQNRSVQRKRQNGSSKSSYEMMQNLIERLQKSNELLRLNQMRKSVLIRSLKTNRSAILLSEKVKKIGLTLSMQTKPSELTPSMRTKKAAITLSIKTNPNVPQHLKPTNNEETKRLHLQLQEYPKNLTDWGCRWWMDNFV